MRDYERTCWTAAPDPTRGPREIPDFEVVAVEFEYEDEYLVFLRADGDREWWYKFNDWFLSHITSNTWIGHHDTSTITLLVSGRDATWFKLRQTGWGND